jgi:hypothetical protein
MKHSGLVTARRPDRPRRASRFPTAAAGLCLPALAAGWIGFYWGQTPDELAREKTIAAALTGQWLELFHTLAP